MTVDLDALVAFLRARLDEKERAAGAELADPSPWNEYDPETYNNPAQVLREVDAYRRIVDACSREVEANSVDSSGVAETVLCLLALPHASHPDYREEWAPDA